MESSGATAVRRNVCGTSNAAAITVLLSVTNRSQDVNAEKWSIKPINILILKRYWFRFSFLSMLKAAEAKCIIKIIKIILNLFMQIKVI